MKVIRTITYEGSEEHLTGQLGHSLQDGICPFIDRVIITIETTYSDIQHEKIGTVKRTQSYEGKDL